MTTTPSNSTALTGTMRDPARINRALQEAARTCHLVSPATSCGDLPEGCSISLTAVTVDLGSETYPIAGSDKVGLGKSALDRIAMAAGLSWDPVQSRRLDDGRNRNYCSWLAVGHYTAFDGSRATTQGAKEIDLRDGSPTAAAMSPKQLAGARQHILAATESKARNRAVRALGVRTSYSKADLAKAFIVARCAFTGQSDDPELRREFARLRAQSMLGSVSALYGAPSVPQLPPAPPPVHSAPPVGQTLDHDDDGVVDASHEEPEPPPGWRANAPPPAETPAGASASTASTGEARVRFGRDKGKRLADCDDLSWYRGAVASNVADPSKARWREDNQAHLDEIDAELRLREGGALDDSLPPPADDDSIFG